MKRIFLNIIIIFILINYGCGQNSERGHLINRAFESFKNKDYSNAIVLFDSILIAEPNSAIAHQLKGRAQINIGQYQEGISSFKRAIELDPNDPVSHHFLGVTYSYCHEPQKATEYLQNAALLDAENDQYQISLGGNYFSLGEYENAKQAYKSALEISPNDLKNMYFYATAARILGEEGSVDLLNTIVQKSEDEYLMLTIFTDLKDHKKFIELTKKIQAENPNDAFLYLLEGDYYSQQQSYSLAIQKYRTADSLGFGDYGLSNNIAYCLIKTNHYEEALSNLNELILESPDYYDALGNRGNALMQIGRFDDAMNDFNRGIRSKPMHPGIYKLRGELFLKMNQREKACDDFNFALERYYQNLYQSEEINELLKENCR
jgi:tetratricopeptide (TPR) repeat protein